MKLFPTSDFVTYKSIQNTNFQKCTIHISFHLFLIQFNSIQFILFSIIKKQNN